MGQWQLQGWWSLRAAAGAAGLLGYLTRIAVPAPNVQIEAWAVIGSGIVVADPIRGCVIG
jgi:hypothetical protein